MLTNYAKNIILDGLGGDVSTSTATIEGYYIGLSTTTPTVGTYNSGTAADCNFTEPGAGSGYSKIIYNRNSSATIRYLFGYNSAHSEVHNNTEIHWDVAKSNWGTITHVGLFDQNNHLLAFSALTTPITVNTGFVATILAGDAVITID